MKRGDYGRKSNNKLMAISNKGKPGETGDAKPWVYRHTQRDHDRQAAKDHNTFLVIIWPGLLKVRLFI